MPIGIARALKAGGGSGNIPKVILENNVYFTVEDWHEICIDSFANKEIAIKECIKNSNAKEVFKFQDDELIECIYSKFVTGAAMRGRYNSDSKTEQKIEVRDDELSNAITTVQKDSLVVMKKVETKQIKDFKRR